MSNGKKSAAKIKRYSVHWFDPDPSVGSELRKIRPCLVVSPDEMNERLRTVIVAPLTSTLKVWPFRTRVTVMGHPSSVACNQLRAIDRLRLKGYIATLASDEARAVQQTLQEIFS